MVVLNTRLALLASILTLLVLSSSPTATSAAAIPVRSADSSNDSTPPDDTTQNPFHHDRPSDLGGAAPNSTASRQGMTNGRWNASADRTSRTWSASWTGTKTGSWARPTSGAKGAPSGDDDDDLSKRALHQPSHAMEGVVVKGSRSRRRFNRRSSFQKYSSSALDLAVPSKKDSRSIVISNKEGSHYVVPPRSSSKFRYPSSDGKKPYPSYRQRRFLMRRKEEEQGTPGVVNIMSPVYNAEPGKKIAALWLDKSEESGKFFINASEKESSEFRLVHVTASDSSNHRRRGDNGPSDNDKTSEEMLVHLQMEIDGTTHCATYNPNPPKAESMTMEQCVDPNDDSSSMDSGEDGSADSSPHKSQVFSFNGKSGVIRPMWDVGNDGGKDSDDVYAHDTDGSEVGSSTSSSSSPASASATSSVSAADVDASSSSSSIPTSTLSSESATSSSVVAAAVSETASSTPVSASDSPAPSPTSTIASREASSHSAQNVTLVFVPTSGGKPSAAGVVGDANTSASGSASPAASATVGSSNNDADESAALTMTKTVTVTAAAETDSTSTLSPSASASAVQGQDASDSMTTSSVAATRTAAVAAAATDDGAASTTTITISSSALPSATSTATGSEGSLNVQVVGDDGKTVGDDDPNSPSGSASVPSAAAVATGSDSASPSSTPVPSPAAAANSDPSSTLSGASAFPSASAGANALPIDPIAIISSIAKSRATATGAVPAPSPPVPAPAPPRAPVPVPASAASNDADPSSVDTSASAAAPTQTSSVGNASEAIKTNGKREFQSRFAKRGGMMTPVSTAPYKWLFKGY